MSTPRKQYCFLLENAIIKMTSVVFETQRCFKGAAENTFISSPEPKAPRWAISIPVTPASAVRLSSVNIFKHLLLWNHWANLTQISYGDSLGWGNQSLFKWSWSHDQNGRHAHIWWKPFKNLLQNQKGDDLGTWYVASRMWGLPSLFKWWSWVDLDLLNVKVKFAS